MYQVLWKINHIQNYQTTYPLISGPMCHYPPHNWTKKYNINIINWLVLAIKNNCVKFSCFFLGGALISTVSVAVLTTVVLRGKSLKCGQICKELYDKSVNDMVWRWWGSGTNYGLLAYQKFKMCSILVKNYLKSLCRSRCGIDSGSGSGGEPNYGLIA